MLPNFPSYANKGEGMASPPPALVIPSTALQPFRMVMCRSAVSPVFPQMLCWTIPNGTQSRPPPVAVSRRSYWR